MRVVSCYCRCIGEKVNEADERMREVRCGAKRGQEDARGLSESSGNKYMNQARKARY